MRACQLLIPLVCLGNGGCMFDQWFGRDEPKVVTTRPYIKPSDLPAAQLKSAARVDQLAHKILTTNPDLKLTPMILTAGLPTQTIYHTGADQLVISEGLVQRCQSDAELAALLCRELASMDAEKRRASAPPEPRYDREPPPAIAMNANAGAGDMSRQAELADWEKSHPRRGADTRPTSESLDRTAQDYMVKAGFAKEDYTAALPLVKFAQTNSEKGK